MVFFEHLKAMKGVHRIMSGGTATFTVSAITYLTINLQGAKKNLAPHTFEKIHELYRQKDKCRSRMELDFKGYLAAAADILDEFDRIAPCESYIRTDRFEAMLAMDQMVKQIDPNKQGELTAL